MTKLKLSTAVAFLPVTLVFIGLATPQAEGDETWNYAGNVTDTCVYGACPETALLFDMLNLSVTFNSPLADDLSSVDLNALSDITSWALTDTQGFIDFSSATGGTQVFDYFSTDANGNIGPNTGFSVPGPNWGEPDSEAAAVSSCAVFCDQITIFESDDVEFAAQSSSDGVWSTAAPEPSNTVLMAMGTGILVLALQRKYRRASQTTRTRT